VLEFRAGRWLLVYDWLWDNNEKQHTYRQRFHFAPELDAAEGERGSVRVQLPDGDEELHVVPLLPASRLDLVRGQKTPDLLGWISRVDGELEPSWTTGCEVRDRATCSMATLLAFGRETPVPGESKASRHAQSVRLEWATDGGCWSIDFNRPDRGDYRFDVKFQALEDG
jgi:hypothetical protein